MIILSAAIGGVELLASLWGGKALEIVDSLSKALETALP